MSNHTTKQCSHCKMLYPATAEYFTLDKRSKTGLGCWCRECARAYAREYNRRPEVREKQLEYNRRPEARARMNEYMKARQKTPEGRAYRAQWYQKWYHGGKGKDYLQKWRSTPEQMEKARVRARRYNKVYRLRPEVIERERERDRLWRETHRIEHANKARRYIARRRKAEGFHTADDVRKQYKAQKGRCWWCGKKVGQKYHVDHVIPLSRGGSDWPDNIVIACPFCNLSKNSKLPHEWIGRLF